METSDIIALAALSLAILSPFLTALSNNRHQFKMKRIEFELEHRAQVIENYIRITGETIITKNPYDSHYGTSCGEIFLYVPENLWPMLTEIDTLIYQLRYDDAHPIFMELCRELSKSDLRRNV